MSSATVTISLIEFKAMEAKAQAMESLLKDKEKYIYCYGDYDHAFYIPTENELAKLFAEIVKSKENDNKLLRDELARFKK